jgi:hypothetical protein
MVIDGYLLGSGRALRVNADRVFCNGVQAEPDALRARVQSLEALDGPPSKRTYDL